MGADSSAWALARPLSTGNRSGTGPEAPQSCTLLLDSLRGCPRNNNPTSVLRDAGRREENCPKLNLGSKPQINAEETSCLTNETLYQRIDLPRISSPSPRGSPAPKGHLEIPVEDQGLSDEV
jgi:hypothetical protein